MSDADARRGVQPLPGLQGKVALVIGGTRGVGRAVTEKLAASGAEVVANYAQHGEAAAAMAKEFAELPGGVETVRGDARRAETLPRLLQQVKERHGRLDILVHAASSAHAGPAGRLRLTELYADAATAVVPLASAAEPAAELMPKHGGRIIVVSASVARRVAPQLASLGMAKAALEALTRFLAVDLGRRGVTVNAVSASKLDQGQGTVRPDAVRALAARTPAGRLATAADVADVVALVCLPEAQWINGQVITADGGLGLLG